MYNKKVLFVDILIFITILFLGVIIYRVCISYYHYSKINNLLSNVTDDNYLKELLDIKKKNKDIMGILEVDNTDYKTFFVQGKDNKEYLARNLYKKKDRYGTPFLDYQVNIDSKKIIIYGHNSRYVNMPFNFLGNYYDEEFYNNNRIINLKLENGIYKYEVVSVFTELSDWSYQDVKFDSDKDLKKNINKLLDKSIYKSDYQYNDEQILVLQTCSTKKEYRKYKRKFLIIVARRIEL